MNNRINRLPLYFLTLSIVVAVVINVISFNITGTIGNTVEMCKLYVHYKIIDRDSQKCDAAMFLVENMRYHYSTENVARYPKEMEKWRDSIDNRYWDIIKDSVNILDNYPYQAVKKITSREKESDASKKQFDIEYEQILYIDNSHLSSSFIISHIDNAFKVWKESKFAMNLDFDDFKEYILPYRSIKGVGYNKSGAYYNLHFSKYVPLNRYSTCDSMIDSYNKAICALRAIGGDYKGYDIGEYAMYVEGIHDCVGIANYGSNILRACGLPIAVDNVVGYKDLSGLHYFCNIYDINRGGMPFNAETSLPGSRDISYDVMLNRYRHLYATQKDSPCFLKNKDEYIPNNLNDPCLKDVTATYTETVEITLPFSDKTNNRLAYLAVFSKGASGVLPATWGEIAGDSVTFKNAMPRVLYFPIYYPNDQFKCFGEPFYIDCDDSRVVIKSIDGVFDSDNKIDNIVLKRKYPRKPNMITVADNLVGGVFVGANRADFSDSRVLYTIKESPDPYFKQYNFDRTGLYKYYSFIAPKLHPKASISMLEWITSVEYGYENIGVPTRIDLTSKHRVDSYERIKNRCVKLLAKDSGQSKTNLSSDGNMLTAPTADREIRFSLDNPQIVTGVRFAPLNADNGITSGDRYDLYYWDDRWIHIDSKYAEYEYLTFKDIPEGKIYWLVNRSQGKEELPFVIIDGEQKFLYYDILIESVN